MGYYKTIKTISVLCFSFVTITLSIFTNDELKVKFRISSMKFCLKSDDILTTLTQVSLSQCVDECATRTDCKAINYFNRLHTCELIPDDDEELFENARRNRACVFVKKTDMDVSEINDKCACDAAETCNVEPDASCAIKGKY
ncbi:uncharacterized protein LOC132746449 [Ruditapes philippinarum]|uniref:uncharacterized protein LOC132746449 n=1 Tax=Ruditapes philippinarum TaxID=129788 RepID=UPI00295B2E79|nr:uncharacterized protein LOC132746449 [Ruditapes philippinarum]